MKVEIERLTNTGERLIRLIADDTAKSPATLRHWIGMLRLAERWLHEGQRLKQEAARKK
jgi:hypothetical protein